MQKIYYYIVFLLIAGISCNTNNDIEIPSEKNTSIQVFIPQGFQTRVVDDDNLANEQIIKNLSIFFTNPANLTVTNKYIHTGFTLSGDYQLITLPVEPAVLQTKDIYVVANYDNESALEAITSIDELTTLTTPEADKTNNLDPLNGFCMSGVTLNFNFNDGSGNIATVSLIRTCTKFRVNVSFPENPTLSTNNSFLIQQAARYTFVRKNATAVLPLSDYFNFAAALPLPDSEGDVYSSNTYVYEAPQPPVITIYTHINNSVEEQEFTATLPIPQRNHLYDLLIRIYEDTESATRSNREEAQPVYTFDYTIKSYNEKGELMEETIHFSSGIPE